MAREPKLNQGNAVIITATVRGIAVRDTATNTCGIHGQPIMRHARSSKSDKVLTIDKTTTIKPATNFNHPNQNSKSMRYRNRKNRATYECENHAFIKNKINTNVNIATYERPQRDAPRTTR